MGFIGGNLGRTKGFKYLIFFLSPRFVYLLWVSMGMRSEKFNWIERITIVSGALRKGDEELRFIFIFKRIPLGEEKMG